MTGLVEYRPAPLAAEDFDRLDRVAMQSLSIQERTATMIRWDRDEYGDRVQVRYEVPAGPEVFKKGDISDKLYASLTRPVNPMHLAVHLTNLSYHKPWTRGDAAWRVVVGDILADLEGVSEYAIVKMCELFRRDPELHYFPDTAVLIKRIRDFDYSLKNVNVDKPAPARAAPKPRTVGPVRTAKNIKRVSRIMKVGQRNPASWTKWEQRFMDAIKRRGQQEDRDKGNGPRHRPVS